MVWRGAGRGVCARAGVGASGSAVGEREGRRRAGCVNKNSQNKQFRIRCVPFHSFLRIVFALLKINGFANKSEFVVQPHLLHRRKSRPFVQVRVRLLVSFHNASLFAAAVRGCHDRFTSRGQQILPRQPILLRRPPTASFLARLHESNRRRIPLDAVRQH